ncbi:MAG: hypothetical protein KJP11_07920 [Gammaproteobacteria bacterium]|nr:hypothetical protein [Gammaproteobacteria bacterium]
MKAILICLVILSTGLVIGFANGGSRSQPPAGAVPNAENLKPLASFAGRYAAWADVCGDPVGAEVRSDFLARVELLAPKEQAGIIRIFEKRYKKKKKNGKKAVKSCIRQGKTDCCTVGPEGYIIEAKKRYYSHLAKLDAAAVPAESSQSAAEIAAAAPAKTVSPLSAAASPTVSSGSNGKSAAATPTSPAAEPAANSSTIQSASFTGDADTVYRYCSGPRGGNHPASVCECVANDIANDTVKYSRSYFLRDYTPSLKACQSSASSPAAVSTSPAVNDTSVASLAAVKAKAGLLSATSTPPQSSRIKKISKADLEPGAIQRGQLASWGSTDGTIMACTGARDTMIRHNIMVMFEVAKIQEHHKERLKKQYDNLFTSYSKAHCGVGLPVTSVTPAEQAYANYLRFQNFVLKCSVTIRITPEDQFMNCTY